MGESHLHIPPAPIQVHLPSSEPKRFEPKDALGFLAASIALLYALGWLVQSFATLQLNLGPLSIPKEVAIATGCTALLPLLPPFVALAAHIAQRKLHVPPNALLPSAMAVLFTIPGHLALRSMTSFESQAVIDLILRTGNPDGNLLVMSFFGALVGIAAAFAIPTPKSSDSHLKKDAKEFGNLAALAIAIVFMLAQLAFFTAQIVPALHPAFGGYICRDVTVTFKDRALTGPYNLIAADDKSCVLLPGWHASARQSTPSSRPALLLVPRDTITGIEEALPPPDPLANGSVVTPSTPKQPTAN